MMTIDNMESFRAEYFAMPENQKKAEKACFNYDRLMVKSIKEMLGTGMDKIAIADAVAGDPDKLLEKTRYETVPDVSLKGKKGMIRVDLIYQKAEFIPERKDRF